MSNPEVCLRKGKWTVEEENYANLIISLFNQGRLPIAAGTTLRSYLSDKLRWYVESSFCHLTPSVHLVSCCLYFPK